MTCISAGDGPILWAQGLRATRGAPETDDVETIREHARRGNFPADLVVEVANIFDADTANATVR